MSERDVFRPRNEPARTIYDAFQVAAEHRTGGWQARERLAIYDAAKDYALAHDGLYVPTLRDILDAEQEGMGHVDYGAKLAYALARTMRAPQGAKKETPDVQ